MAVRGALTSDDVSFAKNTLENQTYLTLLLWQCSLELSTQCDRHQWFPHNLEGDSVWEFRTISSAEWQVSISVFNCAAQNWQSNCNLSRGVCAFCWLCFTGYPGPSGFRPIGSFCTLHFNLVAPSATVCILQNPGKHIWLSNTCIAWCGREQLLELHHDSAPPLVWLTRLGWKWHSANEVATSLWPPQEL